MADTRRNQNEAVTKAAEATRAGAREAADQTEDAVQTGMEGVRRVTEEFGRHSALPARTRIWPGRPRRIFRRSRRPAPC